MYWLFVKKIPWKLAHFTVVGAIEVDGHLELITIYIQFMEEASFVEAAFLVNLIPNEWCSSGEMND